MASRRSRAEEACGLSVCASAGPAAAGSQSGAAGVLCRGPAGPPGGDGPHTARCDGSQHALKEHLRLGRWLFGRSLHHTPCFLAPALAVPKRLGGPCIGRPAAAGERAPMSMHGQAFQLLPCFVCAFGRQRAGTLSPRWHPCSAAAASQAPTATASRGSLLLDATSQRRAPECLRGCPWAARQGAPHSRAMHHASSALFPSRHSAPVSYCRKGSDGPFAAAATGVAPSHLCSLLPLHAVQRRLFFEPTEFAAGRLYRFFAYASTDGGRTWGGPSPVGYAFQTPGQAAPHRHAALEGSAARGFVCSGCQTVHTCGSCQPALEGAGCCIWPASRRLQTCNMLRRLPIPSSVRGPVPRA